MNSTSLRDFEDEFLTKLDQYKKNPALFFVDVFPHATDRQKALLWHFLERGQISFKVKSCDEQRFAHIAMLAFFNFLRFPDDLTIIVFPAKWIYAQQQMTTELIKKFEQLRQSLFLDGALNQHLRITPHGLVRRDRNNSGIFFKYITQDELKGYPRETTYIAYGYQCFTSEQVDQLKCLAFPRKLVFVEEVNQ